jgi:hypothetical protein
MSNIVSVVRCALAAVIAFRSGHSRCYHKLGCCYYLYAFDSVVLAPRNKRFTCKTLLRAYQTIHNGIHDAYYGKHSLYHNER